MQTEQASRLTHYYASFYEDSAKFPEQLKYRRFGAQWEKKLYDDVEELLRLEKELDEAVAERWRRESGHSFPRSLTMLDYPRVLVTGGVGDEGDELSKKWTRHEQLLRTYSQDMCLVSNLFKLPDPSPYASTILNKHTDLFAHGNFGPTNEIGGAARYQDANSPDFVALVGAPPSDVLTDFVSRHIGWIDRNILRRLRITDAKSEGVKLRTVHTFIDGVACIFVPFLLTGTMFALARIRPLMVRIAAVGIFGLIFAASAKLLSGPVSRSSIFSLTAAFYAVASVFVSATDNASCKCT